jgi:enoyl-CoA hydratase/carnithine racemase
MTTVRYTTEGAVALLTLAKPPHNLIDNALLGDLVAAYEQAVTERRRAILLRSDMRHFCAGADVAGFGAGHRPHDPVELLDKLENVPIPTVAAIHGAALGGGFELALTCDTIIAADTATIGMVEVTLGLLPLLGGVQRVVQRAGLARGKELALFGRRHSPAALERFGVINLVVAEAELPTTSLSWAKQLAAGPTVAYAEIKKLANLSARSGTAAADAQQLSANATIWASEDQKRGLAAFATTGPNTAVFEGT